MKSTVTSYNGLFKLIPANDPAGARVEIPLIQRDYAQGREDQKIKRIRDEFLAALHRALTRDESVSLDFVYGYIEGGTFRPLDGQQRLTTLFLLHWYLAVRADRLEQEQAWKRFTYATRPGAGLFCQRLVTFQPPPGEERLSAWIEDQPWYLHTWCHDPTIQSMLVMLDAIQERFRGDDCVAAWERLIAADAPAISFHLLPMEQMGLCDDLYIKMNSRGKPLTEFENFKARFERMLEESCPDRVDEFALKVDGAWSDLLWPYRGDDQIVDDEFLRYFHFITEIRVWSEGRLATGDLAALAKEVYGSADQPTAATRLDFLFSALDTWVGADIAAVFVGLFATAPDPLGSGATSRVVLFGQDGGQPDVNLFHSCCRNYGDMRGNSRVFSFGHTLLLYAVILHRLKSTKLKSTKDFARRLRVLRNLIEASGNEVRLPNMPALVAEVERIVVDGLPAGDSAFNTAQVEDEHLKKILLAQYPQLETPLFQLEDHSILRGCLAAFALDAAVLASRAGAFHRIFSDPDPACRLSLTGALLATGDYARPLTADRFQLGSSWPQEGPWRSLLTDAGRAKLGATRDVLGRLLDVVAQTNETPRDCLAGVAQQWLSACENSNTYGWRYYLVKYDCMREGRSGLYAGPNGLPGYRLCMLDRWQMNSWYRDPYLWAIQCESGVGDAVLDCKFTGYEWQPRWLRLARSDIGLRCIGAGIELDCPPSADADMFTSVCANHAVKTAGGKTWLPIPQVNVDGQPVDTCDRVKLAGALLRDLVNAGL